MKRLAGSRGLLAGMDVDELKAKIEREPGRAMFARICEMFQATNQRMLAGGDKSSIGQCGCMYVTPLELEAGLIHRLTGDREALGYVERMIDVLERNWVIAPPPGHWAAGDDQFTNYFSQAMVCLAADMCRDALQPAAYEKLCRLVRFYFIGDNTFDRHALGHWSGHNIGFTRQICSAVCALVFGEESGHPDWERYVDLGRDTCLQYARWGLDPSGFSYEGVGYGSIPILWTYIYAQLLLQNGRDNLFARMPVLSRIPDAVFQVLFPDCSNLAQISDLSTPQELPWLTLTARQYDRPQDMDLWGRYRMGEESPQTTVYRGILLSLLWMDDRAPRRPIEEVALPTASCAHGTETANFRTSWRADAVYLNVLGQGRSVSSLGHMHADCGHFSLVAHGDYLAVDGGYWNEMEDQHNAVLVDGLVSRHDRRPDHTAFRAGSLRNFQRHELLDYVMVDQSAVKDCRWAFRHVLFVRLGGDDCYVVVIDNINPDDSRHSFWWQLHAHPASEVRIEGPAAASVRRNHARLDLTFLNPSAQDYPSLPHSLSLRADEAFCPMFKNEEPEQVRKEGRRMTGNDLGNSSKWRPRLIAEQVGLNCMLMTVISPRRAGAPPLPVRQTEARLILCAEVDCGEFTDTIVSALDHAYIRLPGLRGQTELALVRRARDGRLLGAWTVDGGDLLLAR